MRYEELTIEGRNAVIEAYRSGKPIPLRQNDRQTVCTGRLSGRSGENDPAGSQKT